jgi:hypothetical protein
MKMNRETKISIFIIAIVISFCCLFIIIERLEVSNAVKITDSLFVNGIIDNKSVNNLILSSNKSNYTYTNTFYNKSMNKSIITYHLANTSTYNNSNSKLSISLLDLDNESFMDSIYDQQKAREQLHNISYKSDGTLGSSLGSLSVSIKQLAYPKIYVNNVTLFNNKTIVTRVSEGFNSYYVLPFNGYDYHYAHYVNETLLISDNYIDVHENIFGDTIITCRR